MEQNQLTYELPISGELLNWLVREATSQNIPDPANLSGLSWMIQFNNAMQLATAEMFECADFWTRYVKNPTNPMYEFKCIDFRSRKVVVVMSDYWMLNREVAAEAAMSAGAQ